MQEFYYSTWSTHFAAWDVKGVFYSDAEIQQWLVDWSAGEGRGRHHFYPEPSQTGSHEDQTRAESSSKVRGHTALIDLRPIPVVLWAPWGVPSLTGFTDVTLKRERYASLFTHVPFPWLTFLLFFTSAAFTVTLRFTKRCYELWVQPSRTMQKCVSESKILGLVHCYHSSTWLCIRLSVSLCLPWFHQLTVSHAPRFSFCWRNYCVALFGKVVLSKLPPEGILA